MLLIMALMRAFDITAFYLANVWSFRFFVSFVYLFYIVHCYFIFAFFHCDYPEHTAVQLHCICDDCVYELRIVSVEL